MRAFFQGIWGAVADKIFEGAVLVAGVIWFFLTNGFSLNKLRASSWETVAVVVWTASVLVVWHSYRSAYAVSQDIKHEIGFAHNYSYAVPKLYTMATSLTIAAVLASLGAWKLSSNTPPRESQPTNALPHIPSASEIADEMDKRKSATKSDAVQPQKQAPKVQIIFKNSPLFTKIRRDRISNTIDGCYLYLYRLGFPVKNELAPIGVVPGAAFRASGTYPGTIYDRQILLPE